MFRYNDVVIWINWRFLDIKFVFRLLFLSPSTWKRHKNRIWTSNYRKSPNSTLKLSLMGNFPPISSVICALAPSRNFYDSFNAKNASIQDSWPSISPLNSGKSCITPKSRSTCNAVAISPLKEIDISTFPPQYTALNKVFSPNTKKSFFLSNVKNFLHHISAFHNRSICFKEEFFSPSSIFHKKVKWKMSMKCWKLIFKVCSFLYRKKKVFNSILLENIASMWCKADEVLLDR